MIHDSLVSNLTVALQLDSNGIELSSGIGVLHEGDVDPKVEKRGAHDGHDGGDTAAPGVGAEEETALRYSPIVASRSVDMLSRTFPVYADELSIVGVLDGQVAFTSAFDGLADAHS